MTRFGVFWRAAALLCVAGMPACAGDAAATELVGPGSGLKGAPTGPRPDPGSRTAGDRPLTVAVRGKSPVIPNLHPLSYRGGFITKTSLYETLVRRDGSGKIVPDLAESWRIEDGGRELVLTLREDARFHDGSPVDAEAVRIHFKRWVGLPEHAWLRSSDRVREITTLSDREIRIRFSEPTALLPDLCAINPCAVRAPGSLDNEGQFIRPIGSGTYRFDAWLPDDDILRLTRFKGGGPEKLDLKLFLSADEACDALLRNEIDLLADSWFRMVPRQRIPELAQRFELSRGPGSSVVYLSFHLGQGPTTDLALRRRIRDSIDRRSLIEQVESGFATPCLTWAAPSVTIWPASDVGQAHASSLVEAPSSPLRLLAPGQAALGQALAAQLTASGLVMELVQGSPESQTEALEAGAYDLRIEQTWGVPYDPYISLTARFLPEPKQGTAAEKRFFGVDPELTRLVLAATRTADPDDLPAIYRQIQKQIDEHVSLVPLYAPERLCVVPEGQRPPALDHDLYRLDL
ncbi:MAG: ABC transporter substrate-binding protein [Planctomycetota bacterium]